MVSELSPTARALRALEILQELPGVRAHELGERLGVTERAARRYVAILRDAGLPVVSERGPYGGYRLGRGVRLPPVVFTQEEALGLVMAVLDSVPSATDSKDLVGSALAKVIRALPDRVGRQASAVRDGAAVREGSWTRPDPSITSALVAAVAARRGVRVAYRSESGNQWDAEVDPWAVVVRFGRWYLLCRSHRADAVRTYRVDRVEAVEQTEHAFDLPDDLDPVAVLEENLGTGWEFTTRVTFPASPAEVEPWIRPPMGRLEPLGTGSVLIGSTGNPAMYAQEWLARVPLDFHVEEGPELRAEVSRLADRFSTAVQDPVSQRP